jgi:hypothetical protein
VTSERAWANVASHDPQPGQIFTSKAGILFYLRKHVKESLFFAQVLFELILPGVRKAAESRFPRFFRGFDRKMLLARGALECGSLLPLSLAGSLLPAAARASSSPKAAASCRTPKPAMARAQ